MAYDRRTTWAVIRGTFDRPRGSSTRSPVCSGNQRKPPSKLCRFMSRRITPRKRINLPWVMPRLGKRGQDIVVGTDPLCRMFDATIQSTRCIGQEVYYADNHYHPPLRSIAWCGIFHEVATPLANVAAVRAVTAISRSGESHGDGARHGLPCKHQAFQPMQARTYRCLFGRKTAFMRAMLHDAIGDGERDRFRDAARRA